MSSWRHPRIGSQRDPFGARAHVATVTIDNPPVNALPVAGWFQLADALRAAGRDPEVRVVILQAAGKGFQAGVQILRLAWMLRFSSRHRIPL